MFEYCKEQKCFNSKFRTHWRTCNPQVNLGRAAVTRFGKLVPQHQCSCLGNTKQPHGPVDQEGRPRASFRNGNTHGWLTECGRPLLALFGSVQLPGMICFILLDFILQYECLGLQFCFSLLHTYFYSATFINMPLTLLDVIKLGNQLKIIAAARANQSTWDSKQWKSTTWL